MKADHLEHGISGGEPSFHDSFKERLAFEIGFVVVETDVKLGDEFVDGGAIVGVDGFEDLENGIEYELAKASGCARFLGVRPAVGGGVIETVSP